MVGIFILISRESFMSSYMFCKKLVILQLLVIWDLLAGQISCSAELSMKKKFYHLRALMQFADLQMTCIDL